MSQIKRVERIDYYLQLFFDDGSVRAIDLLPHLKIDPLTALEKPVNTHSLPVHLDGHALTWEDGSVISADFLHHNSLLIGRWEGHVRAWQRCVSFSKAEVKVEIGANGPNAFLLLDGIRYPALMISSAWFGIHENTAWYNVPFPGDGDDGEEDVLEWEEPPIVFDTLKQLTELVNGALEKGVEAVLDITGVLQNTGRPLYVASLSPRNAAILAKRFKKNAA